MKKIPHILIISLLTATSALAGSVSVQDAQTVASNFYNLKFNQRSPLTGSLKYTRTEVDGTVDFYVFDFAPAKGFVVVSANTNLTPVIGYSAESNFNSQFDKTGLKDWMNHAAGSIYTAIQNNTQANAKIAGQWNAYKQGLHVGSAKSQVVTPLLSTAWGQDTFFNQYCPYNTTDQQTCETGCVATAMAQIMKYWNYPAQGTGSYAYNEITPNFLWNYGIQSADFGSTNYQWNLMPNQLTDTNSSVATLMYQCGVGVAMAYGDMNQGGSGAFSLASEAPDWKPTAQTAYVNYFSYNPNTIQGVVEANYSSTAWVSMIEAELIEGRPVQYVGYDSLYTGHAWVCDGFDENDMFHMNWGWNGLGDGYFSLSCLSADGYNFSTKEAALIGIQPNVSLPVQATSSQFTICSGQNVMLISRGPAMASYSWSPSDGLSCPTCPTTSASPASTTTYIITVDSAGFRSSDTVIVYVKAAPVLDTVLVNNVNCHSGSDGSVSVSVSGDNSEITYVWSSGQSSPYISNLSAGTYYLSITDTTGCSLFLSQIVTEPASLALSVSTVNATCNNVYGKAVANVTGGTPNYFYAWSNGGKTDSVTNLSAGVYEVTVSDINQCSATSSAIVSKADGIEVTLATENATNFNNGLASIDKIENGTSPYAYVWNTGDTTQVIVNAAPGNYSVTVTDANGCYQSAITEVSADAIATGIQNTTLENSFTVFPTLATTQVFVEVGGAAETNLIVLNNIGQVLVSKKVSSDQTQIDLATFSSGVYFVQVEQGGKTMVKRFIVKK